MAKIHAALPYYFDHQAELDGEIGGMEAYVASVRSQNPTTIRRQMLETRLKAEGGQQ